MPWDDLEEFIEAARAELMSIPGLQEAVRKRSEILKDHQEDFRAWEAEIGRPG